MTERGYYYWKEYNTEIFLKKLQKTVNCTDRTKEPTKENKKND